MDILPPNFDSLAAMEAAEVENHKAYIDENSFEGAIARAVPVIHAIRRWLEGERARKMPWQTLGGASNNICAQLVAPVIMGLAIDEAMESLVADGELPEDGKASLMLDLGGWINGAAEAIKESTKHQLKQRFENDPEAHIAKWGSDAGPLPN